jgi:Predicted integral membrane protein
MAIEMEKFVSKTMRKTIILKKLLVIVLFIGCIDFAFSQGKPRLGILPFSGGADGDGETIATLFSFQPDIQNSFTVVPRTSVLKAVMNEQNFQMQGYTDSDTIARIGHLLNADFVVSGHIRRLGDRSLVITNIINVETFEQLAGDYSEYRTIEDIPAMLPNISKKLIAASRRNNSKLPKLAVAPFNIANTGVNAQNAEALAQILTIEIANTGKYSVLPRTTTMQAAIKELTYQTQGYTAEEGAKALGKAINAEYILFAEARALGNMNVFTAQILHVENASLLTGDSREYRVIDDGIKLIPELALLLTDRGAAARIADRKRARNNIFGDHAKFWSIGISAGTSFAAPWAIGTVHGTIAPFKNSFLELGVDYGMISRVADVQQYYSLYPFIHAAFFLPFKKSGGWYAGAGGGYMLGKYTFPEGDIPVNIFAVDAITGINIGNILDVSYTARSNFKSVNHKLAIGYTYRFK